MGNTQIETPYAFQKTIGFEVTEWAEGHCALRLPLSDHLSNRYGGLHGGVLATLLDTALGFAVSHTGDPDCKQFVMTLSLNVNYISVATGEVVVATGHKTGGGRSTAFAEGEVRDSATGQLIATATGVFRYRGSASKGPSK